MIIGEQLPGRAFSDGRDTSVDNVHVGVQLGRLPAALVPGDEPSARWDLDVAVVECADGLVDFRGPAVQGRRGERFIYLTWGNVGDAGAFEMFRRAKLMLDEIDSEVIKAARSDDRALVATVQLTDDCGWPRCARVRPPDIAWSLGP